jgi:hypothetical protein
VDHLYLERAGEALSCLSSERCRTLLQRAQEIQNRLLIARAQFEKVVDYLVRLRGEAEQSRENGAWLGAYEKTAMVQDRLEQIAGPAIVQEEQSLAEAPQRRSAELIAARQSLADVIRQKRSHMMESKIGVGMNLLIRKRSKRTGTRGERRGMTVGATDRDELLGPPRHGAVDGTERRRVRSFSEEC